MAAASVAGGRTCGAGRPGVAVLADGRHGTLGVGWPLLIVLFLAPDLSFAAIQPDRASARSVTTRCIPSAAALAAFAFFNASTPLAGARPALDRAYRLRSRARLRAEIRIGVRRHASGRIGRAK